MTDAAACPPRSIPDYKPFQKQPVGCPATVNGWVCTREPEHPGKHMAECIGKGIGAIWTDAEATPANAEPPS